MEQINSSKKKRSEKSSIPSSTKTSQPEEDSSAFELDENNFYLTVNEARQVAVDSRSTGKEVDEIEFCSVRKRKKRIVIILRNVSSIPDENNAKKVKRSSKRSRGKLTAAQELKDHLLLQEIPCYIIGIPGLLQDLEAIQVMKGLVPEMGSDTAYHKLILAIIQTKIWRKKRKVVVLNLEDTTILCPDELKLFCETVCMAEVFPLDKTKGVSFQLKLEKLTKKICKYASEIESRPKYSRKLRRVENDLCENNMIENLRESVENSSQTQRLELDQNVNEIKIISTSDLETVDQLDPDLKPQSSEVPTDSLPNKNDDEEPFLMDFEEILETDGSLEEKPYENNLTISIIKISSLDENGNVELLSSLDKADDTSDDSVQSAPDHQPTDISNDDDLNDYDLSLLSQSEFCCRVQVRKKRRILSTAKHPELDDHKSILKLLSNSKSKSDLRSSDSEVSLHLSLIFASRPKLFKICLTPDESRFPSAIFTKFPDMNQNSPMNEDPAVANLYKGWVAVPIEDSVDLSSSSSVHNRHGHQVPSNNLRGKLKPKLRKAGDVLKRILQPIGNFFSCESCTNNQHHNPLRRSGPSSKRSKSLVYPGIMLTSEAFDQKD